MMKINQTEIKIIHKNSRTHKSVNLSTYVSDITYIDNATGEGDTLDVTFEGSKAFLDKFYPGTKDILVLSIYEYSSSGKKKTIVNKQQFHVDGISYNGLLSCTMKGISTPPNSCFAKTTRSKTYKKTTLKNIAATIAKRNSIKLHYSAKQINIKVAKQSKETDCSFLCSLCEEYGVAMKIYSEKLVVFSEADYEEKKTIATITPNKIIPESLRCDIDLIPQFTGYKFKIKKDKKTYITYWHKITSIKPLIYTEIGECNSVDEGYTKGCAKVNEANKDMQVVSFQVQGSAKYVAAANIKLTNFYMAINGKYYIERVTHDFSAESGYICNIEARLKPLRLKKPKGK